MKPPILLLLSTVAVLGLIAGCASVKNTENLLVSAGFKVITPAKPDQVALLAKLEPDKLTRVTYSGKTYYVMPVKAKNLAYVGGPKQYQAYLQLRQQQMLSNEQLMAKEDANANSMLWDGWNGWSNNFE